MIRGGVAIGAVAFTRPEPGGYTDDEIALLETFADQAAIAVDDARLLREIEERNRDLLESLELQTATSQILELISENPGDLDAVFAGIVGQASRLCDADRAGIMVREGDEFVVIDVSSTTLREDVGLRFPIPRNLDFRQPLFIDDAAPLYPTATESPSPEHRECRDVRRRCPLWPDQRQSGRGSSFRTTSRPHRPGLRRRSLDRRLQREPVRPTGGADATRRRGQCCEGVVPGDDEPRDPHADECGDRHDRAAARHRPAAPPARVRRDHPSSGETLLSSTTSSTSRRSTPAAWSWRSTRSTCGPASSRRSTWSPNRPPARDWSSRS